MSSNFCNPENGADWLWGSEGGRGKNLTFHSGLIKLKKIQGRIFQVFSIIFLAMRQLDIFVLKFIDLWQCWKTVFDIFFNPKQNLKMIGLMLAFKSVFEIFYPKESLP